MKVPKVWIHSPPEDQVQFLVDCKTNKEVYALQHAHQQLNSLLFGVGEHYCTITIIATESWTASNDIIFKCRNQTRKTWGKFPTQLRSLGQSKKLQSSQHLSVDPTYLQGCCEDMGAMYTTSSSLEKKKYWYPKEKIAIYLMRTSYSHMLLLQATTTMLFLRFYFILK